MRLTQVVCRQHLGFMFKKHWKVQGQRIVLDTGAEGEMKIKGIPVVDAEEFAGEQRITQKIEAIGLIPKQLPRDGHHPLYNDRVCHMYRDHNVLLQGLNQAKLLTKTVEIEEGLPTKIENLLGVNKHPEQDKFVRRYILTSHVFDSMQEKLSKRRDPKKPAWNFPRDYGITNLRKNYLMSNKLLQLCESLNGRHLSNRSVVEDGPIAVTVDRDGDQIRFELRADLLVTSAKPLPPVVNISETHNVQLPDLFPIKHTITLEKKYFYETKNIYPVSKDCPHSHPHTAIIHFTKTEVMNLYETEVTEDQIIGRTLMKAFAIAASQAKQRFGNQVLDLPEPVTVQCVHSDGRLFHFAVLQLNTLNLSGNEGNKNVFWMLPRIPLFSTCAYVKGRPVLEEYNPEVFSRLLAFHSNSSET